MAADDSNADTTEPLPSEITVLLEQWSAGDADALDRLIPLVFDQMRAMAHNFFRKEAPNQTLQTTALVHEVYLRLQGRRTVQWRNQSHFFGSLAAMIRQILVDRARRRKSAKRGGGVPPLPFDELLLTVEARDPELLALDEVLEKLKKLSPRQHQVVELKFFMGLTLEEIAQVLDVAKSTVIKDWANSRAFLLRELSRGVEGHGKGDGALPGHD